MLRNAFRAIILLVIQVLILKRINVGGDTFNYISIFIYPIFLMYLPMSIPVWAMLIIGAFYGYCIDIFYDTILHYFYIGEDYLNLLKIAKATIDQIWTNWNCYPNTPEYESFRWSMNTKVISGFHVIFHGMWF